MLAETRLNLHGQACISCTTVSLYGPLPLRHRERLPERQAAPREVLEGQVPEGQVVPRKVPERQTAPREVLEVQVAPREVLEGHVAVQEVLEVL